MQESLKKYSEFNQCTYHYKIKHKSAHSSSGKINNSADYKTCTINHMTEIRTYIRSDLNVYNEFKSENQMEVQGVQVELLPNSYWNALYDVEQD